MNVKYNLLKTYGVNSWEVQLLQSSQETIENLYFKYPNDPQVSQEYARRANKIEYSQSEISLDLVILVLQRYPADVAMNRLYQKRKAIQESKYRPFMFYGYCSLFPIALGISKFIPLDGAQPLAFALGVVGTIGICFNLDYYLNKARFTL